MIDRRAWDKLARDRVALVALGVIAAYAIVALLVAAGVIGADPNARVGAKFLGPGVGHWLGTDRQGRDILIRTLCSAKVALAVGLVSAFVSVVAGTILGAAAAWFRGWVDALVVWLYSTMESIPSILLLMALAYVSGRGLGGVYLAFCLTFWTGPCRIVRGEVLKLREAEYVEAARALGYGDLRILAAHVVPNTLHLVLVNFALLFVGAIKSEVILSYLGLGVQGQPSWGTMIDQARAELINGFFWQIGAATGAMFILVLAFNVFADALEAALDPRRP
jgi:peptide/nickel transport system permease protein